MYVVAYADGKRTAIDASHGKFCGWEAPDAGRYTEWPLLGGGYSAAAVLGFIIAVVGVLLYIGDKKQ